MALFIREDADRYKISVVSPRSKDSLTATPSKARRLTKKLSRKITSLMLTLMLACLGFFALIGAATPANANPISDGFKSTFCSTGSFYYELESKSAFLTPTTGDENSHNATPYEKYGVNGIWFTTWLGPENQEGFDGKGEFGGKSIVSSVGGEKTTDINKIGDKVEESEFPGFYNTNETCVPILNVGTTAIANAIFSFTALIVFLANFVYQAAYEAQVGVLTTADGPLTTLVNALRSAFFLPFLTPIIMLGALWLGWEGLVKKSSIGAAQGFFWMLGSAVTAVALLTSPMAIPNGVTSVVTAVSSSLISATTSWSAESNEENICKVTVPKNTDDSLIPGKENKAPTVDPGSATRANVRMFQCSMWNNFLYTPWVMGQFGSHPNSKDKDSPINKGWNEAKGSGTINGQPRLSPVEDVAFNLSGTSSAPPSAQNWALYHLDNKVRYKGVDSAGVLEQKRSLVNVAVSQLHTADYNGTYRGDDGIDRIGVALLSVVSVIGAAIFIVVVGAGLIILQLSLILLVMMSPLVLLVGVHPGFGRRIAMEWVHMIIGIAVKQIVLSAFLAFILCFYSIIFMINAEGTNWLFSMLLVVLASIGGFAFKKQMLDLFLKFTPGNAGGEMRGSGALGNAVKGGLVAAGTVGLSGITGRSRSGKKAAVDAVSAKAEATSSAGAGNRPKPKARNTTPVGARPAAAKGRNAGKDTPFKNERQAPEPKENTHRNAGAGSKPSETPQTDVPQESAPERWEKASEDRDTVPNQDESSAGARPAFKTEYVESTATAMAPPIDRKQAARDLKEAGFRTRVGVGTVAKAAMRGAIVGGTTGRPLAAMKAGHRVVAKEKVAMDKTNAAAINTAASKARQSPVAKETLPASRRDRIMPSSNTSSKAAPPKPQQKMEKKAAKAPQTLPPRTTPPVGPESPKRGSGALPPLPKTSARPVPRPKK